MGVRGSIPELQDLARALQGLGDPSTRLELMTVLAEEGRTQTLIGFQRAEDPTGAKWPRLRSRTGHPLSDTGRLRNSLSGRPVITDRTFTISTDVFYAATHQYGATIRAKNPRMRFGGAGYDTQDMVTMGRPMLTFRVGGSRPRGHGRGGTGRWVSVEQVTIPKRQFLPDGDVGRRWEKGLADQAADFVAAKLGIAGGEGA